VTPFYAKPGSHSDLILMAG